MQVRSAELEDADRILALYRRVARLPGGLARLENEVDEHYVENFLARSVASGICLLAVDSAGELRGEIHAYTPGIYCFSHVLSELTIAIDPAVQGKGVGRQLFSAFMLGVRQHARITRVELIARQSNAKAIGLYESLGFVAEGTLSRRIRNLDGSFEADIPMAWTRD